MKIKAIKHDLKTTLWCGPAALAAITGEPTSRVMAALKQATGRGRVMGVYNHELRKAGAILGVRFDAIPTPCVPKAEQPTLARWLRENKQRYAENPVVITVTNHFVTVQGRSFIDNHTKKPVSLKKAPHRRCRVVQAMIAKSAEPVKPVLPIDFVREAALQAIPMTPRLSLQDHTALRRAAALHGIKIDKHEFNPGENWIYPPDSLDNEELDPYHDGHLAYDWKDAHARVREYAKLAATIPCLLEQ